MDGIRLSGGVGEAHANDDMFVELVRDCVCSALRDGGPSLALLVLNYCAISEISTEGTSIMHRYMPMKIWRGGLISSSPNINRDGLLSRWSPVIPMDNNSDGHRTDRQGRCFLGTTPESFQVWGLARSPRFASYIYESPRGTAEKPGCPFSES